MLLLIISCSNNQQIVGSDSLITELRTVDTFTKIKTPSSLNLTIQKGTSQSLAVTANDNIISRVTTTVTNGVLTINLLPGSYSDISVNVLLVMPLLEELQNSGSGSNSVLDFENSDRMEFINTGSGLMEISGSGTDISIINSGSGDIKAYNFISKNSTVTNSGSGDVRVFCNQNLSGLNSGSGTVFYRGTAIVTITNSGSGNVVNDN